MGVPIPESGFGSIRHWHCSLDRCTTKHRHKMAKCDPAHPHDRFYCQEGYACLLDDPVGFRNRFGYR